MKIKQFVFNPFQVNTYIYFNSDNHNGIIIDPGMINANEESILNSFVRKERISIKYIINTHGHIDHVAGNYFAQKEYGAPLVIHEKDIPILENAHATGKKYGITIQPSPEPEIILRDNILIKIQAHILKLIHTPGHSPGGICIIDQSKKIIFSGDLIFKNSIGRTDLPGGDFKTLIKSIHNILFIECDDDYTVYSGHMEATTIIEEKISNPFLQSIDN